MSLTIEDLRRRSEEFIIALNRALYEAGAGLNAEVHLATIYDEYQEMAHRSTIAFVREAYEAATGVEARRLQYLLESLTEQYEGTAMRLMTDEILNREAEAMVQANGVSIPFHAALGHLLNEADRKRRRPLARAYERVLAELNPLRERYFEQAHAVAEKLGYESYVDKCARLSGLDYERLRADLAVFLRDTEPFYRPALAEALEEHLRLSLAEAEWHDVAFLCRAADYDAYFPADRLLPLAEECIAAMGLDIRAGGHIQFDLEERERKSERAFCAPIRVPEEIRLVLSPTGGERDYSSFLHELGHALHYGHIDPREPFEFRYLGDYSVTESFAFTLDQLTLNEAWLRSCLGLTETADYLRLIALRELYAQRKYAAQLTFELQLHQAATMEGLADLYVELLREACLVPPPAENFLYHVDPNLYCARYLRAWLCEAQLAHHLADQFGEVWFHHPEAGDFFRHLWEHGQAFTLQELLAHVGLAGLAVAPLVEKFRRLLG